MRRLWAHHRASMLALPTLASHCIADVASRLFFGCPLDCRRLQITRAGPPEAGYPRHSGFQSRTAIADHAAPKRKKGRNPWLKPCDARIHHASRLRDYVAARLSLSSGTPRCQPRRRPLGHLRALPSDRSIRRCSLGAGTDFLGPFLVLTDPIVGHGGHPNRACGAELSSVTVFPATHRRV